MWGCDKCNRRADVVEEVALMESLSTLIYGKWAKCFLDWEIGNR